MTQAVIDIPDEFPIREIPDTPWWSENYALMGSDLASGSALFYGTGRWHGDRTIWRELIAIALPGGRIVFAKGFGRNGDEKGPGGAFAKYDVLEPGRRVRLTYDGPAWESTADALFDEGFRDSACDRCTVELTFEGTVPVWNMKGDSPAAADIAGAIHIDHIGKVNGTVTWKGESYPFRDGYSVRDHSRGPREVSSYKGHVWTSGHFPESDTAFYVYAMSLQGREGLGMSNAAVVSKGRFYPATISQIDLPQSLEDTRGCISFTLESELGAMTVETLEVYTCVVTGMVRPYDTVVGARAGQASAGIVDGPTRIRWNGEEGLGWSELGFAPEPL